MSRVARATNEPGALAALDGLVVAGVLIAGVAHHYGPAVLSDPVASLTVAAPFLLGWYAVAALLGIYERTPTGEAQHSLRLVAATALGGANVGLICRTLVFGDSAVPPFPAVITATILAATLGVRAVVGRVARSPDRSLGSGEGQAQD